MRKVDYHIHSKFSDGQQTILELVKRAKAIGLESIAITDHYDSFDKSLRNKDATDSQLLTHLKTIREIGDANEFEVFAGIETATSQDGKLRLTEEVQKACDLIICSPHYVEYDKPLIKGDYFNKEYWELYKELLLNQAANEADIAGHPEGYLPCNEMFGLTSFEERQQIRASIAQRYLDEAFYLEYAKALVKSKKAVELHGASETPRFWVVRLLKESGVCFSIGSDAHDYPLLGKNERAWNLAEELKLEIKNPLGFRRFNICRE